MKVINEIEDFISEVKSIPDDVENGSLEEEKMFLIATVKQLQVVVEKEGNPPQQSPNFRIFSWSLGILSSIRLKH